MVAHKFPPFIGGIEMHTYQVAKRMVARGHAVDVLTGDPTGKMAPEEIVDGVRVQRVPAWPRKSDVFFAPGVYRKIMSGDWDLVHIQGFHTFVPPIGMLAAVKKGVPFVFTFHSGGHSSPLRNAVRGVQKAIMRPLLRRAAQLIGVSEFEAEHFSKGLGLPPARFVVVPNGAEIEAPQPDTLPVAPSRSDAPLILSIGRLERYKGHHRAIEAFAELARLRPGARLRVLGEGPYESTLRALVAKLGLDDKVSIGGVPPSERKQMGQLMSSAALIVLLSEYEAHPVAVLEAISLGRRVLVNDSTGFSEMVRKGYVHGVPPSASAAEIAAAIVEELDGKRELKPVAAFDWNCCTDELLKVYCNVLDRQSPADSEAGKRAVGPSRAQVVSANRGSANA